MNVTRMALLTLPNENGAARIRLYTCRNCRFCWETWVVFRGSASVLPESMPHDCSEHLVDPDSDDVRGAR
jgi:hypothetical protein